MKILESLTNFKLFTSIQSVLIRSRDITAYQCSESSDTCVQYIKTDKTQLIRYIYCCFIKIRSIPLLQVQDFIICYVYIHSCRL